MDITSTRDLGQLIKRVRSAQQLTQGGLAGACGTGIRFIVDLEKGKHSCEIEKALRVASMLGIRLTAVEPPGDTQGVTDE